MSTFSEEDIGTAVRLLNTKIKTVDDLYRFWKIAGRSVFVGPRIEQCSPWYYNL